MRRSITILALTVLGLTLALMPTRAGTSDKYAIDPAHCHIGFSVRHLVINNIRGRFTDYAGSIVYDEQDITRSSVEITIKAQSVNTDVNPRDEHLRSSEFFDVVKFPDITFKSTRIEKRGTGFVATGVFTMHGVAKEIAIPFKVNGKSSFHDETHLGVEGTAVIDRRDFGITWSATLDNGGLVVGNDVTIELNIEAVNKNGR